MDHPFSMVKIVGRRYARRIYRARARPMMRPRLS